MILLTPARTGVRKLLVWDKGILDEHTMRIPMMGFLWVPEPMAGPPVDTGPPAMVEEDVVSGVREQAGECGRREARRGEKMRGWGKASLTLEGKRGRRTVVFYRRCMA